jgi:hypothetical protein
MIFQQIRSATIKIQYLIVTFMIDPWLSDPCSNEEKEAALKEKRFITKPIVPLPYPVKDLEYYQAYYNDVIFPLDPKTHFKAAITKRNQWMIENCNLLIAFVQKNKGNSYKGLQYAKKMEIPVVQLG